jgi:ABC-type glutathione transport system ATPase component
MSAGRSRPIFSVHGFSVAVGPGRALVERFGFRLRHGEALGLVGPNGSGKSLLVSAWLGWTPPDVHTSGLVAFEDRLLHDGLGPCRDALEELLGRQVGVVLSEPGVHLNPAVTAIEQLRTAVRLQPRGPSAARRLEVVGLEAGLLDRYPAYLSSGQRQRLALACSLLGQGVLLCDDPSAALDPLLRGRFFAELARQKLQGSLAIVVLASREQDLPPFVDRVQTLERPDGSTLGCQEARGKRREARDLTEAERPSAAEVPAPRVKAPGALAVRVRNLNVRRDGRPVLAGVELDVRAGEIFVVVGESGAGKSTLLEALVRTAAVEAGSELWVLGHELAGLKPEVGRPDPAVLAGLRRRLRIAFQDPDTAFDRELPTGAVLDRFDSRSFQDLELGRRLRERLERCRLVPVGRLSAWDRRALALWAALDRRVRVLLADEPFAGADAENLCLLLEGFAELASRGVAVLIVTHLIPPAAAIAHRAAVFHGGRLVETLGGAELLTRAGHPYSQRLVHAALELEAQRGRLRPDGQAPRLPFEPLVACQAQLRGEQEPYLCAADGAGRVFVAEAGRWRLALGEEAENLGGILALRGLDAAALLASAPAGESG